MNIQVIDTFLDEKDRFEKGRLYEVPDNKGAYFCANRWAIDLDSPVAEKAKTGPVDLDIQNSSIGIKDSNG